MKIDAMIMGITPLARLQWLKKTIDHMDGQNFPFCQKVLAIDEIKNTKLKTEDKNYFEKKGWNVIVDNHSSRHHSMLHALSIIESDVIFYNEDDVMADMPDYNLVKNTFSTDVGGRKCAMLSMTLGGTEMVLPKGLLGDLSRINDNSLDICDEGSVIFLREESMRNDYFFEFPGLFVNTGVLKMCMDYAGREKKGMDIERGLTNAYFSLGCDSTYFKASIAKKSIINTLATNPVRIISECRFLSNLDSNQGSGQMGGGKIFK